MRKPSSTTWTPNQVRDFCRRTGQNPGDYLGGNDTISKSIIDKAEREFKKIAVQGPNKTEAAFGLILRSTHPSSQVLFERYTLKLADRCRYTPDWCVIHPDGKIDFYEVKGSFIFAKALVKPRVAATSYPWHTFFLAVRRNGAFNITEIKPSP